ncbi:MAG: hypothetical protein ACPGVB_00280 [Chitinophagales bacterium]
MQKPITISKEDVVQKSLDYDFLRLEAIENIQKLSGKVWTDYNLHDPGVTILEQLCYTLTDLGFRTEFEIEDILHTQIPHDDKDHTFYTAAEILPCHPLTLNDYRQLIIDRIPEVKNAWFRPIKDSLLGIKGLYQVMLQIDIDPDIDTYKNEEIEDVKAKVRTILNQNRNLCEDFASIETLVNEAISISARVDISPDVLGETVLAKILFELEMALTAPLKKYDLEELQEEGYELSEIFTGPMPIHGFIKPEDLQPKTSEIHISKLIKLITNIEGVRSIRDVTVHQGGTQIYGSLILIDSDKFPVLKMDTTVTMDGQYPIKIFKSGLEYNIDFEATEQLNSVLIHDVQEAYKLDLRLDTIHNIANQKIEELEKYESLQNDFPQVYGISEAGIPFSNNRERKAQVKQLKGYLMLFEQIIANYLSQLANVQNLFSLKQNVHKSYFSQAPLSVPNIGPLLRGVRPDNFASHIAQIIQELDPFLDRRNRFLNHLLARFSETFLSDFLAIINRNIYDDQDKIQQDIIKAKIKFLKDYGDLGKNRGQGFNFTEKSIDTFNVSGLKKRVSLLLGIHEYRDKNIGQIVDSDTIKVRRGSGAEPETLGATDEERQTMDGEDMEVNNGRKTEDEETVDGEEETTEDKTGDITTEFNETSQVVHKEDAEDIQLDSKEEETTEEENIEEEGEYKKSKIRFSFPSSNKEIFKEVLRYGIFEKNYDVHQDNEDDSAFVIYTNPQSKQQAVVFRGENESICQEAILKMVAYLKKINEKSENFYILEHILLRPTAPDRFAFNLIDEKNDILLSSHDFSDMSTQQFLSEELSAIGSDLENYTIVENETGRLQVILRDSSSKPVARIDKEFILYESAEKKIQEVMEYILYLKQETIPIGTRIEFFAEPKKGLDLTSDFYSFNISVMLPSWPARFQNTEFRTFLQRIFALNAPAHISINYYWLDMTDMRDFEVIYHWWLKEKQAFPPEQPNLDDLAYEIIDFVRKFEKDKV